MDQKKLLIEFASKISKAKTLHDSTQAICQKLRKQAAQLQKQHDALQQKRMQTEELQQNMKKNWDTAAKMNKQENQKCNRQARQLNDLRKNKKELQRQCNVADSDLKRHTLALEDLVLQKSQLLATEKILTEKLETTVEEKQKVITQLERTQQAIFKYNKRIQDLKKEIESMKQCIVKNTVPAHNLSNSSQFNNGAVA